MEKGLPHPQRCTLRINIPQRIVWETLLETLGDAQPEYGKPARWRHILNGRHCRRSGEMHSHEKMMKLKPKAIHQGHISVHKGKSERNEGNL